MDFIDNANIDKAIVVCNINSHEADYLDLIFENEKRSGGGEILNSAYDEDLRQFVIIYKNTESAQNVLNFGTIIRKNRVFKPFSIDKRKFLINTSNLCQEVILLLAENILTNTSNDTVNVDNLNDNYALISVTQDIDFNKAIKKYTEYRTRYKEFKLYLTAKLDDNSDFTLADIYLRNADRLNENRKKSIESSTNTSQTDLRRLSDSDSEKRNRQSPRLNNSPTSNIDIVYDGVKCRNPDGRSIIMTQNEPVLTTRSTSSSEPNISQAVGMVLLENEKVEMFNRLQALETRLASIEKKVNVTERRNVSVSAIGESVLNVDVQTSSNNDRVQDVMPELITRSSIRGNSDTNIDGFRTYNARLNALKNRRSNEPTTRVSAISTEHYPYPNITNTNAMTTSSSTSTTSTSSSSSSSSTNHHQPSAALTNLFRAVSSHSNPNSTTNVQPRYTTDTLANYNLYNYNQPRHLRQQTRELLADRLRELNLNSNTHTSNHNNSNPTSSETTEHTNLPSFNVDTMRFRSMIDYPRRNNLNNLSSYLTDGISKHLIDRFPIISYKKPSSSLSSSQSGEDTASGGGVNEVEDEKCSICLEEYVQNDNLRLLCCLDKFHVKCIDKWLSKNKKCPCCKYDILDYLTNNQQ